MPLVLLLYIPYARIEFLNFFPPFHTFTLSQMSKASNTKGPVAVSLPSLADILNDLSSLRSESISLSQQANNLDDGTTT